MIFDFLRRFMYGRYGSDKLGQILLLLTLFLAAVWSFARFEILAILIILLLAFCYFRMLSRNTANRQAENQRFLQFWTPKEKAILDVWGRLKDRKVHRYYRCKQCKTYLRVPKGKGKINIKCPKCGNEFVKKT